MISEQHYALLHLSLLDRVGVAAIHKILNFLVKQQMSSGVNDFISGVSLQIPERPLDISVCYSMQAADWYPSGLSKVQIEALVRGLTDRSVVDKEILLLAKHSDIKVITLLDSAYPQLLRHIHLPPPLLYVRGALEPLYEHRLAVIGARAADQYAQQVIDHVLPPLLTAGWQVVSGGARGADTMAHRKTVQASGTTIAVLGSGLLRLYPEENEPLFRNIVEKGGALVSPFHLQAAPERFNFPIRNRIIAGLSKGCLVVQAAGKSGALITAEFALEQGRQVFAVPGSIFHPLSEGVHKLLGMGAKLVTTASDIIEELGVGQLSESVEQQRSCFTAIEEPLMQQLQAAISLDQLSLNTGLTVDDLQDKLFSLQLEGKVQQTFSGLWEIP